MNDYHYQLIQNLNKCNFMPGSYQKMFVTDLAHYPKDKELSEKQVAYLSKIAYSWRRQLEIYESAGTSTSYSE